MFWVVFLLCIRFGSINGNVFEDKGHSCNDSYPGKESALLNYVAKEEQVQNESSDNFEEFLSVPPGLSWWMDFPIVPLVFATSKTLPEGRCKKQARQFLEGLSNSTLWAAQMFDASTKYPDGVINGRTKHLGNFDECYNIRAKLPSDESDPEDQEIEGRYCLIRFRFQRMNLMPKRPDFFVHDYDPNLSVWDAIDDRGDFRRVKRNLIHTALCVPASCSPEEVAMALSSPLKKFAESRGVHLETTVKPSLCQARRDIPKSYTTGTKVFGVEYFGTRSFVVAALFLLIVGSSWYDSSLYTAAEAAKDNKSENLFLCFSLRRNISSIFSNSPTHTGLDCVHLTRVLFMGFVIFGHRLMQYFGYPMVDSTPLEKAFDVPFWIVIFTGPMVVDGFFGLGGLLLAYGLLEELNRSKRLNFIALIVIRYLRLTPLYMLVIFYHATVLPLMGSGPFWKRNIEQERDHCVNNWWTNLLYVNNYVKQNELCIFQTWYLSVDYHLYIIGLLTIWLFWRLPRKLGYAFLGGLIALSTAITIFVTYTNNIQPIFLGLPFMRDVRNIPYFIDYYIKSHMRMGPYMVGILSGAIIHDHKNSSWKFPKQTLSPYLFIPMTFGLGIGTQLLGSKYFDPNSELRPLETAIYAGLHRAVFALATCLLIVLNTVCDGLEFHYNWMTPRWAPPLARLTYGAFLIHNIHQSYELGAMRSPRVFSFHNVFWDFVPDMLYTFSLSLLLSVAVEGPMRKIERYLLTGRPDKTPTNGSSVNGMKKIK